MSQQRSDETTAFIDVTAYFSKDEWKLLHEWQKELYKNVMKEVHHALISLGPLIATTVVTLLAKESEVLCSLNPGSVERRCDLSHSSSDTTDNPYAQVYLNKEDNKCLNYHPDSEEREKNDCIITVEEERMVAKSHVAFSMKEEGHIYAMDCLDFEKNFSCPTGSDQKNSCVIMMALVEDGSFPQPIGCLVRFAVLVEFLRGLA
ncbi:hypothetical protein NDU88_006432 [Pleurodeles waltl]|uniref:KRAB domain-containing protein n=1 Tax=Pleurodeles waltl TaxID=8319 RepID=A0AAV7RRV9_PLEWA|nr:hypothetical protein NDU88_006432 [Pleurodeles waltl]